jgi:D-alanyl-D-alanine carboxypeptidase
MNQVIPICFISVIGVTQILVGDAYCYSNTNYTILGLIIETVTQNKVANEIRKRILEPLGMNNTFLEHFEPCPEVGHTSHYHWATPEFVEAAGLHPGFEPVEGLLVV